MPETTEERRQAIQRRVKRTKETEQLFKAYLITKSDDRAEVKRIARYLGRSEMTVYDWMEDKPMLAGVNNFPHGRLLAPSWTAEAAKASS